MKLSKRFGSFIFLYYICIKKKKQFKIYENSWSYFGEIAAYT